MMMKTIFYRCWDFSLFITGEGSWKLRPLEQMVLDAVKKTCANDTLKLLNEQLNQKYFIQRMNGSRINTLCFYNKNEVFKITGDDFFDLLFKVEIKVNNKKQFVHVTFYEGYIATIEFKKEKAFYIGKEIKIIGVNLGNSSKSHAIAIDRIEHGKSKG